MKDNSKQKIIPVKNYFAEFLIIPVWIPHGKTGSKDKKLFL